MPERDSRVRWSPAAKNDLRHIWRYFVQVASSDVADRLLRDIQGAGRRIAQRPRAWRSREEIAPGLRSILVHPYVVFYRVNDGVVEIVRVLHQRRNIAAVFSKREE